MKKRVFLRRCVIKSMHWGFCESTDGGSSPLFALHPLTDTCSETQRVRIDSAAKKAFSIHIPFKQPFPDTFFFFYSTNPINLTLPSGTRHPSRCLLTPAALFSSHHFWFSWGAIVAFPHTSVFRRVCAVNTSVVSERAVKRNVKTTCVDIHRTASLPVIRFNKPVQTVIGSAGSGRRHAQTKIIQVC